MSANLTLANGKVELAYFGEVPWHREGQAVLAPMTRREAVAAAGLEWTVALEPLVLGLTGVAVPTYRAIVRQDTRLVLGVASPDYTPLQNGEAFEWLDGIVGGGEGYVHTAGSLGGGKQVWALVKLPGQTFVLPADALDQYLLFRWGHDAYHGADVTFTSVRVVCQNTMNMAMPELREGDGVDGVRATRFGAQRVLHVKHTKGMTARLTEGLAVLGVARKYFEVFGVKCQAMTAMALTDRLMTEYFTAVCPRPTGLAVTPAALATWDRQQETLAALFHEGRHNILPGVKGTVWGAFNAATEYVDHCVRRRSTDSRMVSVIWGGGAQIKQRAFDEAVALVG